jgi:hypothetical protein
MKNSTKIASKSKVDDKTDEYAAFDSALRKILTVPHKELQKRIKRASASRASNGKD